MQGIFQKENTDKALKYGIYRHLPTYEKIIRNLVSFLVKNIPFFGKFQSFACPVKYAVSQFLFQIPDLLGQSGLRDEKVLCCAGNAFAICDFYNVS